VSGLETTGVIVGIVVGVVGLGVAAVAVWLAVKPRTTAAVSSRIADFKDVRQSVGKRRAELTALALELHAADVDEELPTVLSSPPMRPEVPLRLDRLRVVIRSPESIPTGLGLPARAVKSILPPKDSGARITRFSEAIELHARPALWSDLPTYRVIAVDLTGSNPELQVGMSTFFHGVDTSELLGHELAARSQGRKRSRLTTYPIRRHLGAPCDLGTRDVLTAVSALTLRIADNKATFFLHQRDGSKVALAGGLMHLAPSGVFQPSADDPATIARDKYPWLTLCREFAEEYLGVDEAQGLAGAQLSYDEDEPYASINGAYESGELRAHVLFMGLDPVSQCPELVTAVTMGAPCFDRVFGSMVRQNEEGEFRGARIASGRLVGYDFDAPTVAYLRSTGRLTPAAESALVYAWKHRRHILGGN